MTEIQIKQVIGQQEASIDKMQSRLNETDFREYCDAIAIIITLWRVELKKLTNPDIDVEYENIPRVS